jgi:hypothetical protein
MILRPSKHSHPDRTVVALSTLIVKRLKKRRVEELTSLKKYSKEAVSGGEFLLMNALGFLYVLGIVEYRQKTDSIEYMGDHHAV